MSHYKGSGTISQGDAQVSVYCFYDGTTDRTSERGGWRGWFSDEDPAHSLSTGAATLELLDGRTGRIVIELLEAEAPYGGTFRGDGDEP